MSSKYSQRFLDLVKQSAADAIKTASKRAIQKTAEATGSLIENKIADRIAKVSKTLPKNNSDTNGKEILTERYIQRINHLKLRQEIWLK